MMPAAYHGRILQAGLATIGPMHHVMRLQKLLMTTGRVGTTLVPRQQSPFQLGRYHAMLSAQIQQITLRIPGHCHQIGITGNAPH